MDERVKRIIDSIVQAKTMCSYDAINERLTEKRLAWYMQHKNTLQLQGSDPRKAYALVLLHYMQISPEEVPVVYEDDKRITWRSINWCPVLEACTALGLDTREVCKAGWEKSVQEMIAQINPRLHFSRNYTQLRPYSAYCEETIELLG
jgi:tRNA(adenine34) deaminase